MRSKASVWSDLPRRITTLVVGLPLLYKILSHPTAAWFSCCGVHMACCVEWIQLEQRTCPSWLQGLFFCLASLLLSLIDDPQGFHFGLLVFCAIFLVFFQQYHWSLGLLLVTIPFRACLRISQDFKASLAFLLIVWMCDTGALVVGRLAKLLLSPSQRLSVPVWIIQISPSKSMEGFLGGLVGGIGSACHLVPWLGSMYGWTETKSPTFDQLWVESSLSTRFQFGLALSVLAILGDLMESSIKRRYQTKDSGNLLPGHGGFLDRFDSCLVSALFYHYLLLQQQHP